MRATPMADIEYTNGILFFLDMSYRASEAVSWSYASRRAVQPVGRGCRLSCAGDRADRRNPIVIRVGPLGHS